MSFYAFERFRNIYLLTFIINFQINFVALGVHPISFGVSEQRCAGGRGTARAWRATPRPLHARAIFAPTPDPPPRPMVPLVQASGLPLRTEALREARPKPV